MKEKESFSVSESISDKSDKRSEEQRGRTSHLFPVDESLTNSLLVMGITFWMKTC